MKSIIVLFALLAVACGGKESIASKSAAAYREAPAQAVSGGHDHGGSPAAAPTTATVDHSAHSGQTMAAADHSAHGAGEPAHSPMAHEDHASGGAHAAHAAPAMDHGEHGASRPTQNEPATAGAHAAHAKPAMDHGAHAAPAMDHAAHGAHAQTAGGTPALQKAPRSSEEMRELEPAATLRPDAFDAPASAAVSEAAKASPGHTKEHR